jgi:hypothetical protein
MPRLIDCGLLRQASSLAQWGAILRHNREE